MISWPRWRVASGDEWREGLYSVESKAGFVGAVLEKDGEGIVMDHWGIAIAALIEFGVSPNTRGKQNNKTVE